MDIINMTLLVTGFACFASFSWGVKGHFRSTGAMPLGMRVISALSLAGFLWFGWRLGSGRAGMFWPVAEVLFAMSLGIFAWAIQASRRTPPTLAFDDDRPFFLLLDGPYRHVRHPFYLSYMLFWAGTALASPGLASWAAPVAMLAVYAEAAAREERKFAASDLARAYAAYRDRTGMFLPRPTALLAG
jgi:protein-S-isoprenylcysteine O-methyltransferase Ste14